MHLQIFNLDESLPRQTSLRDVAPFESVKSFDLRDLGPRLRLWCRAATIARLQARLDVESAKPLDTITMLGSGDFHHLAAVLIERAARHSPRPFTVVHIDNHPDWVRLAPRWHCGSWINRVIEIPSVAKVITLGVCSDDLVRPDLKGGNLPALSRGRIALFPWSRPPSRTWARIDDGAGHRYENGWIVWDNLAEGAFETHLTTIAAQIETADVWITIDKDVLPEEEALSNWDQGNMPLARVLETLRFIGGRKRLIGADICGEFSPIAHSNWLKRFEAARDQPTRDASAPALAGNERVNALLLRALAESATHNDRRGQGAA